MEDKTCEERIMGHFDNHYNEIMKLFRAFQEDGDNEIYDFGLELAYDEENKEGYYIWLLSYGGPSTEFRFYCNPRNEVYKIVYVFVDWFDRADYTLSGDQFEAMEAVFNECFRYSLPDIDLD